MNMDTADYVLPKNQYREARNLRLVTDNSGNSAELHIIEGNRRIKQIDIVDGFWQGGPDPATILAVNTIRNITVAVVRDNLKERWNILKIVVADTDDLSSDDAIKHEWVFRSESGIKGGITDMLDGDFVDTVLRWESESIIKLYIADGKHSLIGINIANSYDTTSLNRFTAYPNALLNPPLFVDIASGGGLKYGVYQYAYRRWSQNGSSSEISRTTKMIPLVQKNSAGIYKGGEVGTVSGSSIAIRIPGDDECAMQNLDIYRLVYLENGQEPTIELFDQRYNIDPTKDVDVVDYGKAAISTLTTEEFNASSGVHIIPKCIESKYDYLFASGITQDVAQFKEMSDFDTRTYSFAHNSEIRGLICSIDGGGVDDIYVDKTLPDDGVTAMTDNVTAETVKTRVSNLKKIPAGADCVQGEDQKYAPWIITDSVTGEDRWVPVHGGIGPNVRWRFVKAKLDADYTPAICRDDQKAKIRQIDLYDINNWEAYKSTPDKDVNNGAFVKWISSKLLYWLQPLELTQVQTVFDDQIIGSDRGVIRKGTFEPTSLSVTGQDASITSDQQTYGVDYVNGHMKFVPIFPSYYDFSNETHGSDDRGILIADTYGIDDSWTNRYVTSYGDDNRHRVFDYNNPKMTYLFKSLRRGETYRFGLIFYNKYGIASPVKWMQDIHVPDMYEDGFETFISNATSYSGHKIDLAVFPIGIQVEITGTLPEDVVGYEVVRCRRTLDNIKNITQGVLARPIHRTAVSKGGGVDLSSQVYCPTGYLTTARWCKGASPAGPIEGYGANTGATQEDHGCGAYATNFDNFNVYQFVSAETTYQSESTQQMIDAIGVNNLSLDGLKMLFGQNSSKPRAFNGVGVSSALYCGEAGSLEMGHYSSYLYTCPYWWAAKSYTSVSDKKISANYVGNRNVFLGRGLDVIQEIAGNAAYAYATTFWWLALACDEEKVKIDGKLAMDDMATIISCCRQYTGNGSDTTLYSNMYYAPDGGSYGGTGAGYNYGPVTLSDHINQRSMQYIKLYEQSRQVTYRTPCQEYQLANTTGCISLGHIINLCAKGDLYNYYDSTYFRNSSLRLDSLYDNNDLTRILETSPSNIHAKINTAFTPKVIQKGGLFAQTDKTEKGQALDPNNLSQSGDVQFYNASFPFNASGEWVIPKWTLNNATRERMVGGDTVANYNILNLNYNLSYFWPDIIGGPCLILKTDEIVDGSRHSATFSNISAALSIDAVSGRNQLPHVPPQLQKQYPPATGDNKDCSLQDYSDSWAGIPDYMKFDRTSWKENASRGAECVHETFGWNGAGESTGNIIKDLYGNAYQQRVSTESTLANNQLGTLTDIYNHSIAGTLLCNISKSYQVGAGSGYAARQLDVYYSYGDYVDVRDGQTSCMCFNGDCYIQLLEYVSGHKIINDLNKVPSKIDGGEYQCFYNTAPATKTVVYAIPLETNIDIEHDYGHSVSDAVISHKPIENVSCPQLLPFTYEPSFTTANLGYKTVQTDAMYLYNGAYSSINTCVAHTPYTTSDTTAEISDYDTRCFYSLPKANTEDVDSWMTFLPNNYIDTDTRYGAITKLKLFKDALLFWQKSCFGVFDVNETAVVTSEDNQSIILGQGGVLSRYQYLSTIHGIGDKSQALACSDNNVYWVDDATDTIMQYGNGLQELSNTANVRTYLDNGKTKRDVTTVGYDQKYQEVLFELYSGETLVYNEQQGCFTGIYRSCAYPVFYSTIGGQLMSVRRDDGESGSVITWQVPRISIYEENVSDGKTRQRHGTSITPEVTFVVNEPPNTPKVYDITTFGGTFSDKSTLTLKYATPHGQTGSASDSDITDREWDYRVAIPRDGDAEYGHRLRDKTLTCTISSNDSVGKFSLEYVITKYRLSCS